MLERVFFNIVLVVCIGLSVGGIVYGIHYASLSAAPRGGALADVIALLALFCTRNYAADIYEALTRSPLRVQRILRLRISNNVVPEIDDLYGLKEKIEALEIRLEIEAKSQFRTNIFLAISTGIGTFVWGFGDLIAGWFIHT